MPLNPYILTTKDLTILEVMLERSIGRDDRLVPLLRRKIDNARIVFHDDVPAEVATLNSRVLFSVDGRDPDTRVLSHEQQRSPVGLYQPITTLRGLALLGLSEGHEIVVKGPEGQDETIQLLQVLYQPEASRREVVLTSDTMPRKPILRLIRGALYDEPEVRIGDRYGNDDPPGPSAA